MNIYIIIKLKIFLQELIFIFINILLYLIYDEIIMYNYLLLFNSCLIICKEKKLLILNYSFNLIF